MKTAENERIKNELISEKSEIRKKALVDLRKLPLDDALQILVNILGEKNSDIHSDLKKAFLSYKDAALPFLVKALCDKEWKVRKSASEIIGALGDGALKRFLELIPRNEEDVDYWMVQTFSIMGGDATACLIKAFSHPNETIKLAALRAAGSVEDPAIVNELIKILENDNWPIRKAAFDSLEKVHHLCPEAVIEALRTASNEAKYWVIKLAAQKHDPKLIPTFTAIIENDPMESKLEAIRALALIETPEAHRYLIGLLADKTWIIRKTAAVAIWEQGLGLSDELLSAVDAPDTDTRYWSVKLLGRINEPRVVSRLIECLQDSQSSVRAAACQALGSLGDKKALSALMAILSDPSEEVRTNAILAISQIGEKDEKLSDRPSVPRHLLAENQGPCPNCGKQVGLDFTFCPFCLAHLRIGCKKCGRFIEKTWKGCPYCGEAVNL